MSDARSAIFAAIRAANKSAEAKDIAAEATALVQDPSPIRPTIPKDQRLARFKAKATSERVTATISEVAGLAGVPGALQRYLEGVNLPLSLALQPRDSLTALDWAGFDLHHNPQADEPVALSIADAAIAETGSVVFRSGPDAPVLLNFLPLHHVVVVPIERLVSHMEDVFHLFGTTQRDQSRNLNIVTGTSGTADIEAINIRGAHGPRFMHLILCQKLK